MKPLYYYEGIYSLDVNHVVEFINSIGVNDNQIGVIDCLNELEQYCYEYGYEYNDLLEIVGEEV